MFRMQPRPPHNSLRSLNPSMVTHSVFKSRLPHWGSRIRETLPSLSPTRKFQFQRFGDTAPMLTTPDSICQASFASMRCMGLPVEQSDSSERRRKETGSHPLHAHEGKPVDGSILAFDHHLCQIYRTGYAYGLFARKASMRDSLEWFWIRRVMQCRELFPLSWH
jgi:hypothetical protein